MCFLIFVFTLKNYANLTAATWQREKKYEKIFECPLFLVALGAGLLKLERPLLSSYKMDCLKRLDRWPHKVTVLNTKVYDAEIKGQTYVTA